MEEFVKEAFTLLGVGLGIIGLRLYARISSTGFKGFHPDDYLMVIAGVAFSVEIYLAYSVGAFWKGLANNGMTDEERRLLDPSSEEYRLRVNGSKTQVAGWSVYTFLLWTIKAAMCTFYLRLTDGVGFRKRIFFGFGLILSTWISDPINGAQKAGSWACRETFVAIVTSNAPMISPLVTRWSRPIIGSLRSFQSSRMRRYKLSGEHSGSGRDGGERAVPAYVLEDKNPRRGMGPRSVNPIPEWTTVNGSDERIVDSTQHDGQEEANAGKSNCERGDGHDTDLESGSGGSRRLESRNAGLQIVKQTSVEVTAAKRGDDGDGWAEDGRQYREDIGDYYLVKQGMRDAADRLGGRGSEKRQRRSNGFGIGRGF
ncbi:hypothetical protein VTK26DRAFT_6451 [Humicola hyalothermophila]